MSQTSEFLHTLEQHFFQHGRDLPWRLPEPDGSFDAYKVLVSELMLQQTQVGRVIPKYQAFLRQFPTISNLSEASLDQVLLAWLGLGYNRRAKYLWQAAHLLVDKPQPWSFDDLLACKGIGPNTAVALRAYAYDEPGLFLETNVRSVIIHHFFANRMNVGDKEILKTLEELLPWRLDWAGIIVSPRIFYWALMDYGTFLKATVANPNKQSKTYKKQAKFDGSRRQLRGHVLRLLAKGPCSLADVQAQLQDPRLELVIKELASEELISFQHQTLMLYNGNIESQ